MKNSRQAAILDLIENQIVETQEDICLLLQQRGYAVTQATVSRDIKELRLIKVLAPGGKYRYARLDNERESMGERQLRAFVELVLSVDFAQNLMVLKTLPGSAQAAAGALDAMMLVGLLGCVAGDDTIIAVMRDNQTAQDIVQRLQEMLPM